MSNTKDTPMDCKQFEETNNEFEQRIEMAAAKLNWHYQGETHIAFENGYIAGARAEHKYVEPIKLELQKLQNDLDDALDIKNGKGPTALSRLSNELQKQKELCKTAIALLDNIMSYMKEEGGNQWYTDQIEDLIKKSNEI